MKYFCSVAFSAFLLFPASPGSVSAQTPDDSLQARRSATLAVYLDCDRCDEDFIRTEIGFINYVRDRAQADVHILVTTQASGGGGVEYTLTFIGKDRFAGVNDTLTFTSKKADTEDMVRQGMVRTLKLGLIRYASRTPSAEFITISSTAASPNAEEKDQWDYWVFSISTSTYVNGEQASTSASLYGSLSANRVTKDMKINSSVSFDYYENKYDYEDYAYESYSRGKNFNSLIVFSLTDQWSAGGYLSMFTSTYNNTEFSVTPAPAIEYDLYPYSESTRRQLRFLYRIGFTYVRYNDSTIYDKTSEQLAREGLTIALDVKEPWGSAGISLEGSHYFHDLSKYNIGVFGNISLQLIEGLSLDIFGDYGRIHDQLSLEKGGATQEEILLRQRALETGYRYFVSVGLSYTFGSIYNNIVNPRFGSGRSPF